MAGRLHGANQIALLRRGQLRSLTARRGPVSVRKVISTNARHVDSVAPVRAASIPGNAGVLHSRAAKTGIATGCSSRKRKSRRGTRACAIGLRLQQSRTRGGSFSNRSGSASSMMAAGRPADSANTQPSGNASRQSSQAPRTHHQDRSRTEVLQRERFRHIVHEPKPDHVRRLTRSRCTAPSASRLLDEAVVRNAGCHRDTRERLRRARL